MNHPFDSLPPGVRLSGPPVRGPIVITPEQHAATQASAAEFFRTYGPRPRMEDLLEPEQIAEAMAALDAAADAGHRLKAAVAVVTAARQAAGLSLSEVAAKTQMPEDKLSRLEAGTLADPTWSTLDRYARAVGLTLTLTAAPAR